MLSAHHVVPIGAQMTDDAGCERGTQRVVPTGVGMNGKWFAEVDARFLGPRGRGDEPAKRTRGARCNV
jgi:hypothetical protein